MNNKFVYDNTLKIKALASTVYVCEDELVGEQQQIFQIGQTVTASGTGALKVGTPVKIESSSSVNGFVRYFGAGMWHLQTDLV